VILGQFSGRLARRHYAKFGNNARIFPCQMQPMNEMTDKITPQASSGANVCELA
jgi:hypothetical protein